MNAEPSVGSVPSIALTPASGEAGRWSVAGAIGFAVLVVGSAMLAGLAIHYGWLAWRVGWDEALAGDAHELIGKDEQRRLFVAIQLAGQLLELLLIFMLVRLWHGDWRRALGLGPAAHGPGGWITAILLLFAVKLVATVLAAGIAPPSAKEELAPFVELARSQLTWGLFLVTVLLAGVTEELVFRGVLSRTLEATRLGFWGGAALASASFAVLHMQYGPGGQLVVFAIGMTLAWIRRRADSLWPAIVCHALNNGVALLAMRAIG